MNTDEPRDITLPDGTVRHNVGSDNLSDEDRKAMELTNEDVAALNADAQTRGAYAPNLTEPEDFGKSPPFAPEPELGTTFDHPDVVPSITIPEDEDVDPDNPDGELPATPGHGIDVVELRKVNFDAEPEEVVKQLMASTSSQSMKDAFAAQFKMRVEASRIAHEDFVTKHMSKVRNWNGEVKFANALDGRTYFVSFIRNDKRRGSVVVPPVMMSGKVENLRPGKLYACSGREARMLERVLATKGLELLNITPAPTEIQMAAISAGNQIGEEWRDTNKAKQRDAFAKYREEQINEGDDLKTVAISTDMEESSGMGAEYVKSLVATQSENQPEGN